ncbi:DUF1365 family protein [Streptomyces sp. MBT58]|uniref:DUF1365 family protein n=1 Tax=Streptomyces sp. MBT58 TaxID=1488389 RepID=UPI0035ABFE19
MRRRRRPGHRQLRHEPAPAARRARDLRRHAERLRPGRPRFRSRPHGLRAPRLHPGVGVRPGPAARPLRPRHRLRGCVPRLCVVAEVHNTYGERHGYLLHPDGNDRATTGKEFYVSPFFPVDGGYRMRLPEPGDRLDLSVHLEREGGRPFTATVRGTHRPATPRALARLALRHPLSTIAVSLAIRLHGIRLYLRGLPVQPRPQHRPQEGMQ